jgi:hypothetical protein
MVAAAVWALSLAVYQPFMEPHGFWTDSSTGESYPNLGSNNTYWPRDMRQLAILLAFGAVILICHATRRGIAVGAIGTGVWLAADLVLDRFDATGLPVLLGAGLAWFAVTAFVAVRTPSTAAPQLVRTVCATATALLAPAAMVVTTPWDEPVTDPAQVRVENALSILQIGLAAVALAVAVGIAGVAVRSLAFVGLAGVGIALAAIWPNSTVGTVGTVVTAMAAALAASTAAANRLLMLAVTAAAVVIPFTVALVVLGAAQLVGELMTQAAGNPAINSADSDVSLAFTGLALGVALGFISHGFGRPLPPPDTADSAVDVAYN